MRILHLSNHQIFSDASHFYMCDRKFSSGFDRIGHCVYDYSYKDMLRASNVLRSTKFGRRKVAEQLRRIVQTFQPDLLLLGHVNLPRDLLEGLRAARPEMRVIAWFVDYVEDRRIGHLRAMASAIDALYVTTGGAPLRKLGQELGVPVYGYLPNPVHPAIETGRVWQQSSWDYGLVYCGADRKAPARRQLLEGLVNELPQVRMAIRGSMDRPPVFGQEYLDLLQRSLCGLNLSKHHDLYWYSSDRIAQLTGNGLCTLSQRIPGFEELYCEDEVVYFDNYQELRDKVHYLTENPKEAASIGRRGWEKSQQEFNVDRVCRYMLEGLEGDFSEDYLWLSSYFKSKTHRKLN